jgi:Protein of unknown function (DUF2510)
MTDDDIAEGWYTDSEGSIRWWDGTQWTEHVRNSADPEATAVIPADRSATTARHAEPEPEPDHKRRTVLTATVVGLLAFFLGMGIGGSGDTPETPVVGEATASSGATEEDLDRREAELESREGDLRTKEEELDQREEDLAARELQEPSGTGDGTIENGVFEVGEDVDPGLYSTEGSDDPDLPCTYRVSEDDEGDEIIISEVTDGPGTVTLEDGQYFRSEYCQTWQQQ